MSDIQNLPITQLYQEVNHITSHGIQGYHIQKKYADPLQMMKSRELASGGGKIKKRQLKRGSYLEDETNAHKNVPGPGKYGLKDQWPKKSKSLHHESKKVTYIEQIMNKQKREKKPAPGHYNTFKSLKELDAEKKKLQQKKIKVNDRISYLDHIQYEATLTPGIGAYNPRERIKTQGSKIKMKPEEWRKKHQQAQKNKKPPKLPDMGTYNPLPTDFALFSSMNKVKSNKNFLGNLDRFKTPKIGSGIAPGKYGQIQEWRGKDVKDKNRHGLQSLSKGVSKSVYYH